MSLRVRMHPFHPLHLKNPGSDDYRRQGCKRQALLPVAVPPAIHIEAFGLTRQPIVLNVGRF
ncbi:MAG TPA: hypothetical protein VMR70_18450 [Flavisolibacter sp.]|nr:hypothetical protein [Flavisolibacter sp.]